MINANELISVAESLPLDLKMVLIDRLLNSLNPSPKEIDELWAKEAEKRVEEIRTGKVKPVDGEEVFGRLRAVQSRSRFGICERDLFNNSTDYSVSRNMDTDKQKYTEMPDKPFSLRSDISDFGRQGYDNRNYADEQETGLLEKQDNISSLTTILQAGLCTENPLVNVKLELKMTSS
jgi:putative addiction module component (TIGR02574 family)